ncbi:GYDIA family GHMP kinase [Flavobacterium silvaticum]|uniref:GHMP kinase n=1 Tax=Flavobacterium silvaticum TaxID=1852020 RepID=A0A972FRI6_9FLAO|nr:GYDIA family GHMP kinase [Flavobacterium silvaticum]NMH27173.1 GHMP kinase [Flavobacterium silvaticum]
MEQHFYANGKLLITAEYVVLDGAKALAFPTKKGQHLTVSSGTGKEIRWRSFEHDGTIWFEDRFTFDEICTPDYVEKEDNVRQRLLEILHEGYLKNPGFLAAPGLSVETHLTFDRHWGLGTSSTLISNIAAWLQIDAFQLLRDSFGGSGYDIACAQHDSPITYQLVDEKPVVTEVAFRPDFKNHLYFVYLNKKQSSKAAIASYYKNRIFNPERVIQQINKITEAVLLAPDLKSFAYQLEKHESLVSGLLEMHTVKEALFPDFNGVVKSLGGWGGDFVLAVSKENPVDYFSAKGFDTVIPFDDMIL